MQCDICGKNEATVHLTEIVNDVATKLHLCEGCARDKGAEMEEHFGLSDLLSGLADLGVNVESKTASTIKCASCGLTYLDFKKIGRLGCSECYEAFGKELAPLLRRIHGADRHIGKVPLRSTKAIKDTRSLQDFKLRLEKAIQTEEFEEAARLRDKIKEVEKRMKVNRDKDEASDEE